MTINSSFKDNGFFTKRFFALHGLVLLICLMTGQTVFAQIPANDNPCNAITLTPSTTCTYQTFTNANATATTGIPAPGCASYNGGDVWFQVTVPAGGALQFDSDEGTITDGGMAIYNAATCSGPFTLIACNDDGSANGNMPFISASGLTPGSTVWVRFWEFGGNGNGTFGICVSTPPPPPANDNPCNATVITPSTTCTFQTFTNAAATSTTGVPAPGCANYSGGDVWFQVTVPAGGALIFDSQTGVITDGGMAIYRGPNCSTLSLIACDDDASANGLMPFLSANSLTPGSTVWIRFWEYGNDNNGTFGLCVKIPPPPPVNDNPCTSINLTPASTCTYQTFSNEASTGTTGVPAPGCAGYTGSDVWFNVVVPAGGALNFDTQTGEMLDGGMAIYRGASCSTLTLLACDDNSSPNGLMPSILAGGLNPGDTIWVRVWENGNNNNGTFGICVTIPPPGPANDNPCNATPLTPSSTCTYQTFTNANATASVGNPNPTCAGYSGGDVWFQVTVPAGGALTFDTQTGTMLDGGMAIYRGSTCTGLTQIACDDNSSGNGNMPKILATGLTPGSTVWVRVWENGNNNNGTFGICVTIPPPPPANDNPCNAIELFPATTCTYATHTNVSATGTTGVSTPACGTYSPTDVWFKVVVPAGGAVNIDLLGLNIGDAAMAVYRGNSCSTLVVVSCDDDNSLNPLMPFLNIINQTPGNTLYIRVWNKGGALNTGDFGICTTLPPPQPLTFNFACVKDTVLNCGTSCFSLAAVIPNIHASTNSYEVNPLSGPGNCFNPYVNPGVPGTATSLTTDDVYTPVVNLPFGFPFFGSVYNSLVVSTNGLVSFDATRATLFSHYSILNNGGFLSATAGVGQNLPSALYDRALIMGPYHDLDPAYTTSPARKIKYNVVGTAPNRRWVLSFYKVPLFNTAGGCDTLIDNTHQIVLYEGTGIVEVFVFDKEICTSWNNGKAMIGMQNFARNQGIMAPGRRASDPAWGSVGMNESWRFVPATGASLLKRVELYDTLGNLIANGDTSSINLTNLRASFDSICPPPALPGVTTPLIYIVKTVYQKFDDPNAEVTGTDTIRVYRPVSLDATIAATNVKCNGGSDGTITITPTSGTAPFSYSINGGIAFQSGNSFTVPAGTYNVSVKDTNNCRKDTVIIITQPTVLVASATTVNATCVPVPDGIIQAAATGGTSPYLFSTDGINFQTNGNFVVPQGSYTVTVTDSNNCVTTIPAVVNLTFTLTLSARPDTSICSNKTVTLTTTGNGLIFSWSPTTGLNDPSLANPIATLGTSTVDYIVTAQSGPCTLRDTVKVIVLPDPVVNAGTDVTIVKGEDAPLFGTISNVISYLWSPATYLNDPTVLNPVSVRPAQTILYQLSGTNATGCIGTDNVKVTVIPYCVNVKNGFTPNGDGINDNWSVYDQYDCLSNISVEVYNRYGSKVYENKNYRNEWRGTYEGQPLPDATYYYVVKVKLITGRVVDLRGDLTIIR